MPLASPNNPTLLNLMYGEEPVLLEIVTPNLRYRVYNLHELREKLTSHDITKYRKEQVSIKICTRL